jgi:hypothetical protein
MSIGPVPATAETLKAAGMEVAEVDPIELNEAFTGQVLAVTHDWGLTDADFERTELSDSGISPYARSTRLLLGQRGPITPDVLHTRAAQAGVDDVHPHRFRHTFAHRWLAGGGQEWL